MGNYCTKSKANPPVIDYIRFCDPVQSRLRTIQRHTFFPTAWSEVGFNLNYKTCIYETIHTSLLCARSAFLLFSQITLDEKNALEGQWNAILLHTTPDIFSMLSRVFFISFNRYRLTYSWKVSLNAGTDNIDTVSSSSVLQVGGSSMGF